MLCTVLCSPSCCLQPLEPWNYRGRLGTGVTDCHVIKQPRTSRLSNSQLRSFSHTGKGLTVFLTQGLSLLQSLVLRNHGGGNVKELVSLWSHRIHSEEPGGDECGFAARGRKTPEKKLCLQRQTGEFEPHYCGGGGVAGPKANCFVSG